MARDVMNFNRCLVDVEGLKPTGLNENSILSMAVARYVERFVPGSSDSAKNNMYSFKDFDISVYSSALICKILHKILNFTPGANESSASTAGTGVRAPVTDTELVRGSSEEKTVYIETAARRHMDSLTRDFLVVLLPKLALPAGATSEGRNASKGQAELYFSLKQTVAYIV